MSVFVYACNISRRHTEKTIKHTHVSLTACSRCAFIWHSWTKKKTSFSSPPCLPLFYLSLSLHLIHNKQAVSVYYLVSLILSAAFLQLNRKVGLTLPKAAALRINLNLDGVSISSKSHTHSSHSQTSRLLTSSLSLGVPVPRPTQCV
jgi:hypothetical protein